MQKIILYLKATDLAHADWVIMNEAGSLQKTVIHGNIEELFPHATDSEFTVVVPAEDMLLTTTKMPKMNRQRLRQALPYQLEEQLLGDVADLFFATGTYQADQSIPVAVINKQKLEQWIAVFAEGGVAPRAFVPACLVSPLKDKSWSILMVDEIAIIRTGVYSGLTCESANLQTFLESQLANSDERPETLKIRNYTHHPFALKLPDIKLDESTHSPSQFIEDLAHWLNIPAINLLQGPYQPKRKTTYSKKIWVKAAYVFLAWIGLLFISNIISIFILHHQASTLESGINTIYKRHFPEATAIIAPKQRMEDKLNELSSQSGHNPLLLWLGYTGAALKSAPGTQIKQFEYRDNQLTLQLSATDIKTLGAFVNSLNQRGLALKQQNTVADTKNVTSSLIITGGAKS